MNASLDPIYQVVERHLADKSYGRILDIGAWYIPYWRSTHIIDRLPWETRGGELQLHPVPGERFTKDTWTMLDITDQSSKFPFPDKYFDFVICGGTLEDLPDPRHCIAEINRIGRAGYIRVPTMNCELTVGVEDRSNNVVGYVHHNWICRSPAKDKLVMISKADTVIGPLPVRHIPLVTFEKRYRTEELNSIHLIWQDSFEVSFTTGAAAREVVAGHLRSLRIPPADYVKDGLVRFARRVRDRWKGRGNFDQGKQNWWQDVLAMSKPYMEKDMFKRCGGA